MSLYYHPAFIVNRILNIRHRERGFQNLVDLEGCIPEERAWIPRSFILDLGLITSFYKEHHKKILDCLEAMSERRVL